MSDAIYFAKRNFTSTFTQASHAPYNPLRLARRGTEHVATLAQHDKPGYGLCRQSIPAHLAQVTMAGPRYGAQTGSYIAGALHGFAAFAKEKVKAVCPERVERAAVLKKTSVTEKSAGFLGTLAGALLGFAAKSVEHAAVTAMYVGFMALGTMAGAMIGWPASAVYGAYVMLSSDRREALRARRKELRETGLARVVGDAPSMPIGVTA